MLTSWKHNFVSVFLVSSAWKKALGEEFAIFSGENMTQWHLRAGEKVPDLQEGFKGLRREAGRVFRDVRAGPVSPERGQSRLYRETEDYGPSVNGGKHKVPFKQMLFTW